MLLLPAMLLVTGAAIDSCTPLDRPAFAAEVAADVRKALGLRDEEVLVEVDQFRLKVKRPGGNDCLFNLHNLADEVCGTAVSDRAAVVKRYVAIARSSCGKGPGIPATYAAARASLLPVVRSRMFVEGMSTEAKMAGLGGEPLGEHLHVALVVDLPDVMSYLPTRQLADWGVTWKTAYADALANLRARSAEPFLEVSPGLWMGPWEDAYGPSRLLLTDKLRGLVRKGDVVVTVPSQRAIFACGAEDAAALESLARHTEEASQEARAVSLLPLLVKADGLGVFAPPRTHPAHQAMDRLRLLELDAIYRQDKEALEKRNEADGVDVFVASYKVMRSPEGEFSSAGVLAVDVPTWLPRTDVVLFVDPKRTPAVINAVPFEKALEALGPRATLRPGYPSRWEVKSLPPAAELAKLPRAPGF